jgi:hypothetical protein
MNPYSYEKTAGRSSAWLLSRLLWVYLSKPAILFEKWFWYAIVWVRFGTNTFKEARAVGKKICADANAKNVQPK